MHNNDLTLFNAVTEKDLVKPRLKYDGTPPNNPKTNCNEPNFLDHSLLLRVVEANNTDLARRAVRKLQNVPIEFWRQNLCPFRCQTTTIMQAKDQAQLSTNATIRKLFSNLLPRHIKEVEIAKITLDKLGIPKELIFICLEYTNDDKNWDCRRLAIVPAMSSNYEQELQQAIAQWAKQDYLRIDS